MCFVTCLSFWLYSCLPACLPVSMSVYFFYLRGFMNVCSLWLSQINWTNVRTLSKLKIQSWLRLFNAKISKQQICFKHVYSLNLLLNWNTSNIPTITRSEVKWASIVHQYLVSAKHKYAHALASTRVKQYVKVTCCFEQSFVTRTVCCGQYMRSAVSLKRDNLYYVYLWY